MLKMAEQSIDPNLFVTPMLVMVMLIRVSTQSMSFLGGFGGMSPVSFWFDCLSEVAVLVRSRVFIIFCLSAG